MLKKFGVEKKLSGDNIEKFLGLNPLPTDEAGYFLEFVNTNPLAIENKKFGNEEKSHSEIFYLLNKT